MRRNIPLRRQKVQTKNTRSINMRLYEATVLDFKDDVVYNRIADKIGYDSKALLSIPTSSDNLNRDLTSLIKACA